MDVEEVGLGMLGHKTQGLDFAVGDGYKGTLGGDHFHLFVQETGHGVDDALQGLSVKAIDEDSLRGAGGQSTNQNSILFQTIPHILYH
jgi:hypothetical protein